MSAVKDLTTKEKLNNMTRLGFSNTFISDNVKISSARIYNAGSNRKVKLSDIEENRISEFYINAMKLIKVGGEG